MSVIDLLRGHEIPLNGIVHVGANIGNERLLYRDAGVGTVVWVEPIESVFQELQANIRDLPGQFAVKALCSDRDGDVVRFNIASNLGESSSMFDLGAHGRLYPSITYVEQEEMITRTLDNIISEEFSSAGGFDLLVLDVQGAELKVLQGAQGLLRCVEAVFVEVSEQPLYEGGCTLDEVSGFLRKRGMTLRFLNLNHLGWGDAFYVYRRAAAEPLPPPGPNLALHKPASQSSFYPGECNGSAQGAVNGIITDAFGFHTQLEVNPWWQVDLQSVHVIREIRIYNRCDVCRERSRNLVVLLSRDGSDWTMVHDQGGKIFGSVPLRVFPDGMEARFLRIQLNGREYLHLAQVEVY
jgi:FkbM family methyltransferase